MTPGTEHLCWPAKPLKCVVCADGATLDEAKKEAERQKAEHDARLAKQARAQAQAISVERARMESMAYQATLNMRRNFVVIDICDERGHIRVKTPQNLDCCGWCGGWL